MLSDEFNNEMAALIRSLQQKVRTEPGIHAKADDVLGHIESAIVQLVRLHLDVQEDLRNARS